MVLPKASQATSNLLKDRRVGGSCGSTSYSNVVLYFWCGDRSSELFYILINILRGVWGVGAGGLPPSKQNLTGPNAFRGVWGVRPPATYNICILTPSSPIVIIIIITYHHLSSPITILRLQRKKYCASGENILGYICTKPYVSYICIIHMYHNICIITYVS